jgi:hypothetical protein
MLLVVIFNRQLTKEADMNFKPFTMILSICAALVALAWDGPVRADTVSASLNAQYFEISASSGDPDVNVYNTPNVALGSSLGPNGMPVATSPFGVNDINPTTNEITWWSPTLNSNVVSTGTGTITLPYASYMYAPNSTGSNDYSFYETAIFSGNFNLATTGTVQFQLGSDDDTFIYVDGTLFGQNPGVHAVTNVNFTTPELTAGSHNIKVFYADRQHTGAYLSLNLLSSGVVITPVPLPPAIALFVPALAGLGFAARRCRRSC